MSVLDRKLFKQMAQHYANGGHVQVLNPQSGQLMPDTKGYPFYDENNPRPSWDDANIYRDSNLNKPWAETRRDVGDFIGKGVDAAKWMYNEQGPQLYSDALNYFNDNPARRTTTDAMEGIASLYDKWRDSDLYPESVNNWLNDQYIPQALHSGVEHDIEYARKLFGKDEEPVASSTGDLSVDLESAEDKTVSSEIAKLRKEKREKYETEELIKAYEASKKIPPEEKMSLAEELGIDLTDPYDDWAWVRDMSAGLLASEQPTLFSAWGEAALASNKNRDVKEAWAKEMDAKLKLAKWTMEEKERLQDKKSAQDLNAAWYKAQWENKGIDCKAVNGICIDKTIDSNDFSGRTSGKYHIVKDMNAIPEGVNVTMHPTLGIPVVLKTDAQFPPYMEQFDKELGKLTEGKRNEIVSGLAKGIEYNGEPILRLTEDDDRGKNYYRSVENISGMYNRLLDLQESGKFNTKEGQEERDHIMGQIMNTPGLNAIVYNSFQQGPFAEKLGPVKERLQMKIDEVAADMYEDAVMNAKDNKYPRVAEVWGKAAEDVLMNVKWDLDPNLPGFWNPTYDTKQYEATVSDADTYFGTDDANEWFNTTLLNFAENPKILSGRDRPPLQLPNERPLINRNQYQLADKNQKGKYLDYVSEIGAKIAQENGLSPEDAREDAFVGTIVNRSLWGGEDTLGSDNQNSIFHKPERWILEPNRKVKGTIENPKTGKPEKFDGTLMRDVMRKFGFYWEPVGGVWRYGDDESNVVNPKSIWKDYKPKDINP